MSRDLKPAREGLIYTINHFLSLVAAGVYVIGKLRAYLREGGKDRRRVGERVRVSVSVHRHAHACMHTHAHACMHADAHAFYETSRFMLMHTHDEYMRIDKRLDTPRIHAQTVSRTLTSMETASHVAFAPYT